MVAIPKQNGTIDSINSIEYGGKPRPYLGMSGIGESCWRKLWYNFHWVNITKHNARTERIFDIGHLFESIAISDLKKAGCFIFRVDQSGNQVEMTGEKGEEQEELIGFAKHSAGHPDGRINGLREYPNDVLLLELKTMNDDKFKSFKKNGIEKSNNVYYCQAQKYMLEMNLTHCFFLAINKNTCEYWWEFIHFDIDFANELKRKEQVIIISDEPPERAYDSNHYKCNWCEHYNSCHGSQQPEKNCRTCDYSDLEDEGIWSCNKHSNNLSVKEQRAGCDDWKIGWNL